MDELDDCFCGDPLCVNPWHVAKMARDQCIAQGTGDPLVAVAHMLAIAAATVILVKWPPPLWIYLPFALAFAVRFELLWRQARRRD